MLTALGHIQLLRFVGPAVVVFGVAPYYLITWLAWRLASLPLSRRVFERGDEIMYDSYQSLICFFFETLTGAEVILYGDQIPWNKQENVIVICNHQSSVDWIITDFLAVRQGSLGRLRYILKNGLKYFPLYGFYFAQHSCIYVKRSGAKDQDYIARKLTEMKARNLPMWLVIFPEGTRYNVNNKAVIEKSQAFATEQGLPVLTQVLTPRTKATEASFKVLSSDYLDAVYDFTITYSMANEDHFPRRPAPTMSDFLISKGQQVHVYCRRHEARDLPKDSEGRKSWIHQTFAEKDRILNKFYQEDGKMPGVPRRRRLPWTRTSPYFVFWMATLLPFVMTKWGRSAYWKMWLVTSFGSVSYMMFLFGKVQR